MNGAHWRLCFVLAKPPQTPKSSNYEKSSVWMCFAYRGSGEEPAPHWECNECQQMFCRREKNVIKLPPKNPLWEQQQR